MSLQCQYVVGIHREENATKKNFVTISRAHWDGNGKISAKEKILSTKVAISS